MTRLYLLLVLILFLDQRSKNVIKSELLLNPFEFDHNHTITKVETDFTTHAIDQLTNPIHSENNLGDYIALNAIDDYFGQYYIENYYSDTKCRTLSITKAYQIGVCYSSSIVGTSKLGYKLYIFAYNTLVRIGTGWALTQSYYSDSSCLSENVYTDPPPIVFYQGNSACSSANAGGSYKGMFYYAHVSSDAPTPSAGLLVK